MIAAGGFIINAAGVQHFALLERQLRFVAITVIERFSQLASVIVSITMAVRGLWLLGARSGGDSCAGNGYALRLVNHVLDPGTSASRSWHQIDASLRRNGHLEWLGRVRCL